MKLYRLKDNHDWIDIADPDGNGIRYENGETFALLDSSDPEWSRVTRYSNFSEIDAEEGEDTYFLHLSSKRIIPLYGDGEFEFDAI